MLEPSVLGLLVAGLRDSGDNYLDARRFAALPWAMMWDRVTEKSTSVALKLIEIGAVV